MARPASTTCWRSSADRLRGAGSGAASSVRRSTLRRSPSRWKNVRAGSPRTKLRDSIEPRGRISMNGRSDSNRCSRSASLQDRRSSASTSHASRVPRRPALALATKSAAPSSEAASSYSIGERASARTVCGGAPSSPNESMSACAGKRRTSQRAMSQPKAMVTGVHARPLLASLARARAGPSSTIRRAASATRFSSARVAARSARVSG